MDYYDTNLIVGLAAKDRLEPHLADGSVIRQLSFESFPNEWLCMRSDMGITEIWICDPIPDNVWAGVLAGGSY